MHVLVALRMGGTELGVVKLAQRPVVSRVKTTICSIKPADSLKDSAGPGCATFRVQSPRRAGSHVRAAPGELASQRTPAHRAHAQLGHSDGGLGRREARPNTSRGARRARKRWKREVRNIAVQRGSGSKPTACCPYRPDSRVDVPRVSVIRGEDSRDSQRYRHPTLQPPPSRPGREASLVSWTGGCYWTAGRLVPSRIRLRCFALWAFCVKGLAFSCVMLATDPCETP